jgi:hypothetical protein
MTSDAVGGAARLSVVLAMAAEAAAAVAAATPRRATVWSMVATQKAGAWVDHSVLVEITGRNSTQNMTSFECYSYLKLESKVHFWT